jgi:hypothetical protein
MVSNSTKVGTTLSNIASIQYVDCRSTNKIKWNIKYVLPTIIQVSHMYISMYFQNICDLDLTIYVVLLKGPSVRLKLDRPESRHIG